MAKYQDQEFVEYVIKSLVDHPEEVSTDRKIDEMGVLLTLKVNPQDMGQVIGRQGGTAQAEGSDREGMASFHEGK